MREVDKLSKNLATAAVFRREAESEIESLQQKVVFLFFYVYSRCYVFFPINLINSGMKLENKICHPVAPPGFFIVGAKHIGVSRKVLLDFTLVINALYFGYKCDVTNFID